MTRALKSASPVLPGLVLLPGALFGSSWLRWLLGAGVIFFVASGLFEVVQARRGRADHSLGWKFYVVLAGAGAFVQLVPALPGALPLLVYSVAVGLGIAAWRGRNDEDG